MAGHTGLRTTEPIILKETEKLRYALPMSLALLLGGAGEVWAGERKDAHIDCRPTSASLVFDCMITLKGKTSGRPIEGAEFMVGADMPSMPGAHNVKAAPAKPHDTPGMYSARVHLEMFGEWAVKLDFTKPDRDRVVRKLHFGGEDGNTGHDHSTGMSHDHMKKSE